MSPARKTDHQVRRQSEASATVITLEFRLDERFHTALSPTPVERRTADAGTSLHLANALARRLKLGHMDDLDRVHRIGKGLKNRALQEADPPDDSDASDRDHETSFANAVCGKLGEIYTRQIYPVEDSLGWKTDLKFTDKNPNNGTIEVKTSVI
jgi:hypothetical protein